MNHKRFAFALLAVIGTICAFSSPAHAGGLYFGINFGLIGGRLNLQPSGAFGLVLLPMPGVQIGYDFGDGGEGFGVRASFNVFVVFLTTLDGYRRFALDANGSNAYVGAGVELQYFPVNPNPGIAAGLHALVGLEWRPIKNLGLLIEATPGVLVERSALAFTVIVRGGLVLHF